MEQNETNFIANDNIVPSDDVQSGRLTEGKVGFEIGSFRFGKEAWKEAGSQMRPVSL